MPLEIKNWQVGIAPSPHLGFANMQHVDIGVIPGVLTVGKQSYPNKPVAATHSDADYQITFTAADTDIITLASGKNVYNYSNGVDNPATGVAVTVSNSGGALPAGLSADTVYFLVTIDASARTYKLATSLKNALAGSPTVVNITDAGTGTHTLSIVKMGLVKHKVEDPGTNYIYFLDENGRVWVDYGGTVYLLAGNTLTNGNGNGLAFWKDYLVVFRNHYIDFCNVSTSAKIEDPVGESAWSSGVLEMNTAAGTYNPHNAIVGEDDCVYFTDDRYIGQLEEAPGQTFAGGTAGTYIFTVKALDLPGDTLATCLDEYNVYLAIGCSNGKIYLWNKAQDATSFNYPLNVGEYVHQLISVNNFIYIFAGYVGNIYVTDGSSLKPYKKFPEYISYANAYTSGTNACYFGKADKHGNKLIFGIVFNHSSAQANSGVYSIDLIDNRLMAEAVGAAYFYQNTPPNAFKINAGQFGFGFKTSAEAGLYYQSYSKYYTDGTAIVDSMLYTIGTYFDRKTYNFCEVELANELVSGESLTIKYRKNLTDTWTTLGTVSYATYGAVSFQALECKIADIETLQVRAELTTTNTTPSLVKLRRIVFY